MSARRRGRGRLIATGLAFACLAVDLVACGQRPPSHPPVSLLPYTAAKGQSWDWSAACPYGPHAGAGCADAGPVLGTSQLAGNEWNLGGGHGATGSVSMSMSSSGALKVNGDLSSAPPCTVGSCLTRQANTWVRGFPSVLYGTDQCHAPTSPKPSPDIALPARVDSLPADLIGRANYDAEASAVTYDVAYDIWLNPSNTATPCQTDGTIEVMVWTDYDAQALLPDSLKVGTTTVPFVVNGEFKSGYQDWSVYANNIYGGGHTAAWGGTIWIVLNSADATQQGTVTVDLSAALAAAGTVLQNNYGFAPFASTYWLDTIAFGMEFGPQSANAYGDGPAKFSLGLNSYCLQTGSTVPAVTC